MLLEFQFQIDSIDSIESIESIEPRPEEFTPV